MEHRFADSADWYGVLGVRPGATQRQIAKAYRRRVRQCHPDLNDDPGALKRFYRVQWAYDVLSDPQRRRRYDESRVHRPADPANPFDPALVATPMDVHRVAAQRRRARRQANWISIAEVSLVVVDLTLTCLACWLVVEILRFDVSAGVMTPARASAEQVDRASPRHAEASAVRPADAVGDQLSSRGVAGGPEVSGPAGRR